MSNGKAYHWIKKRTLKEEISKGDSSLEFQMNRGGKQGVLVFSQTSSMSERTTIDLASAYVEWETFQANNATDWESADMD
jgi:hypothetical protein